MSKPKPSKQTFTVADAVEIFSGIDEKIISLHNCSTDDFLSLNENFKQFYADSKVINENAGKIVHLVTDEHNGGEFSKLLTSYREQITTYKDNLVQLFASLDNYNKEVARIVEMLFIPSHNFNQNLMTLKLMIANLRFDNELREKTDYRKAAESIDKIIKVSRDGYTKFSAQLELLKQHTNQSLKTIGRSRNFIFDKTNEIISVLESARELLSRKHEEAIEKLPEISEKTENNSKAVAKIITNLQYHDIIRQKIEHVQRVHKEILDELKFFKRDNGEQLNNEEQLKYYQKIKDIASLQANQLLYANREYQSAIEVITQRLLELGDNLNGMAAICERFSFGDSAFTKNHFREISDKLIEVPQIEDHFLNLNQQIELELTESFSYINGLNDTHHKLGVLTSRLEKIVISFIVDPQKSVDIAVSDKIRGLVHDITSNRMKVQYILGSLVALKEEKEETLKPIFLNALSNSKVKAMIDDSKKLIDTLKVSNDKLIQMLQENQDISSVTSTGIKAAVSQVKYYDFFDKVIEEIINQLNELYFKLSISLQGIDIDRKQNLDDLRRMYTMKSEHEIHDKLTGETNGSMDLFDKVGQVDEDDDNLELF
jgi:tetratricopeptide (TPR) repeat protein